MENLEFGAKLFLKQISGMTCRKTTFYFEETMQNILEPGDLEIPVSSINEN
jgi:hypothetical protein